MREWFKFQIKIVANKHVANMLDKLCYSAVDNRIKPELQLPLCQKLLLILQYFKNFDSNVDKLIDFKNFLESQASHAHDKSIFNSYVALNSMIAYYQSKDARMPELEKGIDAAIAFLQRQQDYLKKILVRINQLNKTSQTQTSSNRKRNFAMFADKPLQAYIDKSAETKMRRTDDEAVAATHSEPKSNDKSYFCT